MESKNADELLEVIVNDGVVHPSVDIIQSICDNRMALHEIEVDSCCCLESFCMNAQSTEVPNDEAFQFLSFEIKASNAILWVAFKSYAVLKHRREEGLQKYGHKPESMSEKVRKSEAPLLL